MSIQRIRRLSIHEEAPLCDYCDEHLGSGYVFSGEGVGGPRSGTFLTVCDPCLKKARESDIGFALFGKQEEDMNKRRVAKPPEENK